MKKIYYLPGLISAVLIPLLFWYYGNKRVHPQYTVMDLGIPAKHKYNDTLDNTLEPYRNWNYKKIVVKPNTAIQNQQYYVLELKKLQARNEKETGIEFIINDHNSYQDFISLMSTMELAQQETFGVDVGKTGHFFAVHFYKDPNKDIYSSAGCTVGGEYHEIRDHINFSDLENLVKNLPKQSFYVIFGFLFLLNFSMLSIKERFQIQY
ncbi:hypothetical protein SAMN05421866_2788 [Chryseobacterium oranimense]|uniref:Uncharacterized protein n=1 Tax=Chryseobacterium oranimense TaxID=421058 RepID=A0A1M5SZT3_9FLAO|nr:hypothetical protein [Chryseobacterium oranimense]SHH44027.1 hypothetical protein SAMN05421866_2788 [Chryseobacterium oranimense]